MYNPKEMDKLLETCNLPRLNQEETENMKRPITNNEIESLIRTLPTNKIPVPSSFTGEFCQTFEDELALPNYSKIIEEKAMLPN